MSCKGKLHALKLHWTEENKESEERATTGYFQESQDNFVNASGKLLWI